MKVAMIPVALFLMGLFAAFYGWVSNILKLIELDAMTGMTVARAIGVVAFPLGALLGYF